MIQLTVRDVDQHLSDALKREAAARGLSVNRLVLLLLRESLGQSSRREPPGFDDLDHLAGTWSAGDAAEFERHLSAQRRIDDDLWN